MFAAPALLGFMTMSTACNGSLNIMKNGYHWNSHVKASSQINDKRMKEFIFFGMLIVPAYVFSALLATLIFHSIHFCTGESPIKASDTGADDTKVTTVGDTTIRWTQSDDGVAVRYEGHGVVQ